MVLLEPYSELNRRIQTFVPQANDTPVAAMTDATLAFLNIPSDILSNRA